MIQVDPLNILKHGAKIWNNWRDHHPGPLDFASPHWHDSMECGGMPSKGANCLDFSGVHLCDVNIYSAFAEGLNLRGAVFENTVIEEGDFSRCDFSGATFRNTRFNKTILTQSTFEGATFNNCNLNRVNLTGADFRVREICETVVYGLSAWDLNTSTESRQSKLVIEKTYEFYSDLIQQGQIPMMVDDIELAQFVYYLSDHKKMRQTLNILNDRGVLLLGRFQEGGLARLDGIRQWFQERGFTPMMFDFARPDNLSLTETVVTMAGLSKFILVDLSGPSVPAELQAILSQIKKPLMVFGDPYALAADLADHTRVFPLEGNDEQLLASIEQTLPAIELYHAERQVVLARRYQAAEQKRLGGAS